MKKTNLTLIAPALFCSVLLFFTSCKKYLDEYPETEFITEDAFSSVDSAYHVVLGAYNQLAGDPGYGIRLSIYYPSGTDESMNPSANTDGGRSSISRYETDAGNVELSRPYRQLYKGIEITNHCIENIPQMASYKNANDPKNKEAKRLLGEALTLRAQFYLDLIKIWGDVPSPMKPAAKNQNEFPQKEDRDIVYEKLLDDLELAKSHLPWRDEVDRDERITKSAAMALRAKIALFRAGWSLRRAPVEMKQGSNPEKYYTIARDECKAIIDSGRHTLNPDFKRLFKDFMCSVKTPVDPDGEIIFQVAMAGRSAIADSKLGYSIGPRVNGFGNSYVLILPTAFYQFDSTDLRRDVSVAPYDVNLDGTKKGVKLTEMRDGKFRREWITPSVDPNDAGQYFSINWPLIRYSDILLMYAEAQNELTGPTTEAYEAVNMVRRRAYGKPITAADTLVDLPAGLGKSTFFDAIVKERLLEFMGEGLRKYDLIRWNLLAIKIQETRTSLEKMAKREDPYNNIPAFMYYYNDATADNSSIWANSLYWPSPITSNAIRGATRVNWVQSSNGDPVSPLVSITLARFAVGFSSNHDELFPIHTSDISQGKLPQDYGF